VVEDCWIKEMNFFVSSPKELSRRDLIARKVGVFLIAIEGASFALGNCVAINLGSRVSLIA